ncbi:MAG: response regulator [Polyangiaceae bacterium]
MSEGSAELYDLFLALAPSRASSARAALDATDPYERARGLMGAMLPFAVDATLLGADGLSALSRAIAAASGAPRESLEQALDTLEASARALEHGDESGARVDETALKELAASLAEATAPAQDRTAAPRATSAAASDDSVWEPTLGEDMISAFLDECVDRLEGLSERLLNLEQSEGDPELVGEIFRDLHTLKGSSAFAGLKKMNRVAHLAEDLIGALRDGKRQIDRNLVDVLLETLDALRAIVECARNRAPIDVDVSLLVQRLQDPSRRFEAPSASDGAAATTAPHPEKEGRTGTSSAARPAAAATLRIEFDKVDQLLNLVGEIVLARGRLGSAQEVSNAVLRELPAIRKKLSGEAHSQGGMLEDLQRTERVLAETQNDLDAGLSSLGLSVGQLRDTVMKLRMVPIARLFTKYQRTVRELANKLGKQVNVELVGAETELDKVLVERLEDPLLHLVRNSVDHGIELPEARRAADKPEAGRVRLSAAQRGGQIIVAIEDDGKGMDPDKLRDKAVEKGLLSVEEARGLSPRDCFDLIFRAGFSTADQVSDVSGRGVGMDVVRDTISKLKGTIVIDSELGRGTRMELRLPLTLAITQVLAAKVGEELVAIPLDAVVSAQAARADEFEVVADGRCLRIGARLVPVVDLGMVLGLEAEAPLAGASEHNIVVVEVGSDQLGLIVHQVLGRHEVVIKSLGPLLAQTPCAAGATLIGDRVCLVADLGQVAAYARSSPAPRAARRAVAVPARARILVAEDSDMVREAIARELTRAGFAVVAARDGREALELSQEQSFDAVCTDVMMPRMDGYDLVRELRRRPAYATTPVVMVTSKDARIDALRGADAGANAYLTKPVDGTALVRTLGELLQGLEKAGD